MDAAVYADHQVTSEDVVSRFNRSRSASSYYKRWTMDPRRSHVVPRLTRHVSRYVNTLGSADVLRVCSLIKNNPREHALGNISKREADIAEISDWNPSFAFVHAFHFVLEAEGRIPTFNEAVRHKLFYDCILADARARINLILSQPNNLLTEVQLKRAVKWRVGLCYYALLKELYVTSLLREEGYSVSQHPLADALFRTDFWVADTNIDLFMNNKRFRAESEGVGRKMTSTKLWADASPAFSHVALTCPPKRRFGDIFLPDARSTVYSFNEAMAAIRAGS